MLQVKVTSSMKPYIGTIAGSDDETSVENKLHVAGTRCPIVFISSTILLRHRSFNLLCSCSGNVLANVRRGDNHLGLADVVVFQEDNLEQVANVAVLVDNFAHSIDQVNDLLGHPVAGSSLATKDGDTWQLLLPLLGAHCLESQVPVDNSKDVELLALIFVNSLDLDVEQGCWVDRYAERSLNVLGQAHLVGILDLCPLLAEGLVLGMSFQLVENSQILQEIVTTALGSNQLRQARVGLVQPTSGGDAVGHVGELVRAVNLNKVLENGGLDQIRVQLSHTVDLVGTYNGQEGHSHHLGLTLLNDGDSAEQVSVIGEGLFDLLQEEQIDIIDNLKMSGQQMLNQSNGPLLQGLWEHGVVGVAKLKLQTRPVSQLLF